MPQHRTALLALAVLALAPSTAQAVQLGVQDDGRSSTAVVADTQAIGGGWTRAIAYVGQPGIAERIRDAHHAGLKVILTVGGTGTRTRKPTAREALRYIRSLPRADRYSIINEPDLSGIKPCDYLRRWKTVRRELGRRLLFGDFSPHAPLTYTAAVVRCGHLPRSLDVALHPYQWTDPLSHGPDEGSIGNLGHIRRALRGMGIKASLWLTEFGYLQDAPVARARLVTDAQAAWLWPRAVRQATRNHARVLIAYTAQGASWDTRPGPLAWCSMTLGRTCPGAVRPDVHRQPIGHHDSFDDALHSYAP